MPFFPLSLSGHELRVSKKMLQALSQVQTDSMASTEEGRLQTLQEATLAVSKAKNRIAKPAAALFICVVPEEEFLGSTGLNSLQSLFSFNLGFTFFRIRSLFYLLP